MKRKKLVYAGIALSLLIGYYFVSSISMFHEIRDVPMAKQECSADESSVTYVGHATALIHLNDLNLLTDPVYSETVCFIIKRHVQPGIRFEDLPVIDAILISHEHWDHLDKATLKRFDKKIPVIISKGLEKKLESMGFTDVRGLDYEEHTTLGNVRITAYPVAHRVSKSSSYLIEGDKTIYFVGDSGLTDKFRSIGDNYDVDATLLPIGAYKPRLWFIPGLSVAMRTQHMHPEDIPSAIEMINPDMMIPMHYGVFKLTYEPVNEPLAIFEEVVRKNDLESKVRVLEPGEKYSIGGEEG